MLSSMEIWSLCVLLPVMPPVKLSKPCFTNDRGLNEGEGTKAPVEPAEPAEPVEPVEPVEPKEPKGRPWCRGTPNFRRGRRRRVVPVTTLSPPSGGALLMKIVLVGPRTRVMTNNTRCDFPSRRDGGRVNSEVLPMLSTWHTTPLGAEGVKTSSSRGSTKGSSHPYTTDSPGRRRPT